MGRAAVFVLGASMALGACGASTNPADAAADAAPDDDGAIAPLYGDPAFDGGTDVSMQDVTDDDGGVAVLYGLPPTDP
jgi:hypothetical protein